MWREEEPTIYEWQVLPFGTTCSPCYTIYALQCHLQKRTTLGDTLECLFYVDNCLYSIPTPEEVGELVDALRHLLKEGGFEIRQWACDLPSVIEHLPPEARLSKSSTDLCELTLRM
ncbi:hypothetical protein LDENG_00173590 [Lucifuga dentata]|nr:hypothetical protein LDENG_00173590 [Lucifuga dentata]